MHYLDLMNSTPNGAFLLHDNVFKANAECKHHGLGNIPAFRLGRDLSSCTPASASKNPIRRAKLING